MQVRDIENVRRLSAQPEAYLVSVEIETATAAWTRGEYAAWRGAGGAAEAIMDEIAAGRFSGPVTDIAAPPEAAPATLQRVAFWLYLLTLGLTRADVHAAIDAALAAETMAADYAAQLRIKVDDAATYERLDPDLLDMAQRLGLAADQAALDAHFIAANG